jgi:hypothetical protein
VSEGVRARGNDADGPVDTAGQSTLHGQGHSLGKLNCC